MGWKVKRWGFRGGYYRFSSMIFSPKVTWLIEEATLGDTPRKVADPGG